MNWDAIGAIEEVIGAFAVVLSLLYLALQIRHSSKMAEDTSLVVGKSRTPKKPSNSTS